MCGGGVGRGGLPYVGGFYKFAFFVIWKSLEKQQFFVENHQKNLAKMQYFEHFLVEKQALHCI